MDSATVACANVGATLTSVWAPKAPEGFFMKNRFKAIALFAAIVSATGAAAFAQTHNSMMGSQKGSSMQGMMTADQMMTMCEEMMRDMRSDPVLMKHMNAIMQKHMMKGGMMNGGHSAPSPHS